jgi:hypothetical protein
MCVIVLLSIFPVSIRGAKIGVLFRYEAKISKKYANVDSTCDGFGSQSSIYFTTICLVSMISLLTMSE